jgi:hypothetical protein
MAEEPLSTGNDDPAADLTPKVGQARPRSLAAS